jgi:integrase
VRRAVKAGGFFEQLTNTDIDRAPKYLRLIKASVKSWCQYQGDSDLLLEISQIKLPPAIRKQESTPLTKGEWKMLLDEITSADYLEEPMRADLGMMACRGFRCGDVLRLQRTEAVKGMKTGILDYKGKGSKRLKWSVVKPWKDYLELLLDYKDWDQVQDLICPAAAEETRKSSAAKAVTRALEIVTEEAGLDPMDMHPHLLRHTYATFYYEACLDPSKLQAHMGWGSIETAMLYVRAGEREELDEIANSLFDE